MTSINDVLKASKGLPVDDIFAELWGRKLSGGYTIDVYTGTLPAVLAGTKAGYLHRYKIYGNLTQNGIPTPENPIVPSECGERTENLFEVESDMLSSLNWDYNPTYVEHVYFINYKLSDAMTQELKRGQHTCSIYRHFTDGYIPNSIVCAFAPTIDGTVTTQYRILTGNGVTANRTFDFSKWQDIYLIIGGLQSGFDTEADKQTKIDELFTNWRISIVAGSTAPTAYTPYGYKLPLSSAGQSVDIYLGESQATRQIRKLVLTGEENWSMTSNNRLRIGLSGQLRPFAPICSHYTGSAATAWGNLLDKSITVSIAGYLAIYDTTYDNTTDFKAYLSQQYANGTPVTVWYVLTTPTTGILNEPLRKIGDYADTVDPPVPFPQIPTSAGSTTISWAGNGLAPSEVEFEYERRR